MSYATGTTHYNLPQTVGTDKRDWTDTNEAFSAVDTALYGAVQDAETATSGIQTLNTAVDTINGKLTVDEGNISTLSGKVSTLESTVSGHTSAIADVRSDLQDNIESYNEASATSTHAYVSGDTFYYNDVLYKATANIGVGDTIVPSTNCTAITVMSEIDQINSDLTEMDDGVNVTSQITGENNFTVSMAIKYGKRLHLIGSGYNYDFANASQIATLPASLTPRTELGGKYLMGGSATIKDTTTTIPVLVAVYAATPLKLSLVNANANIMSTPFVDVWIDLA